MRGRSILCGSMMHISSYSRMVHEVVRQGRFVYEGVVGIKQTHTARCCENLTLLSEANACLTKVIKTVAIVIYRTLYVVVVKMRGSNT